MTESTLPLKELQELDERIEEAKERVKEFDPLLAQVDEPALELESEVDTTRARLQEMRVDERRLELSIKEKSKRVEVLEERLNQVRNVREESAVRAELDMVRQALEGDEQEGLALLDQIRKLEVRLEEQEEALEQAREAVEPRRLELLEEREEVTEKIDELEARRDRFAESLNERELRMYEGIRGDKGRRAVAELTVDGACSHCFSMIPLQLQNEIRHGAPLIRCEGCGVILTGAPEPEEEEGEEGEGAEA